MKKRSLYPLLLIVGLLVFTNDDFQVWIGWQEPPVENLSEEEKLAINRELSEAQLPPLRLEKVTLQNLGGKDPMHDTRLVFSFDRPLNELERDGFGRRSHRVAPWRYSIAVRGIHELAVYRPIRTLEVSQLESGKLKLIFYETIMHPKPFRREREFVKYADVTFTPDGLRDFQLCLYRCNGHVESGNKFASLSMVGEWKMADLKRVSETEWVTPENFDATPSTEAIKFYDEEMDIPPASMSQCRSGASVGCGRHDHGLKGRLFSIAWHS